MFQWLKNKFQKAADPNPYRDIDDSERWIQLEEILGFQISDRTHYERALRHRSIIDGDSYEKHETYERLEFLGDAVLDLIITEIIFDRYPTEDEGFMTKLRAKLVKGDTLANLAGDLNLNDILEIGERAKGQGIELSKSVLSDVFESLIAAVYLTEGYRHTFQFVESVIDKHLDLKQISVTVDNFKSVLLEFTQAHKLSLPQYRVISETGPGHDKTFEVAVVVEGKDCGTGKGKNKKQAEQIAAKKAIKYLRSSSKISQ
jgi:ribonuclease III